MKRKKKILTMNKIPNPMRKKKKKKTMKMRRKRSQKNLKPKKVPRKW